MFYRFEFEAEFYPALERVPFHVRMKLDLAGVRVSLSTWRAFSLEERRALCHLPVDNDEEKEVFAAFLAALAKARAGVEAERCPALDPDAWAAVAVPGPVAARSEGAGVPVTPAEWGLTRMLSSANMGLSAVAGSTSNASIAAPAIVRRSSASTSAASLTMPPRAVFTT